MERKPVVSAVYRTQPVRGPIQAKPLITHPPRRPLTPSVYRPDAKRIVQPKPAAMARRAPNVPPVYRPAQTPIQSKAEGQRILDRELMHVVQQRAGRASNPFGSGVTIMQDPITDSEADRMGLRAAAQSGPISRTTSNAMATRPPASAQRKRFGTIQRLTVTTTSAEHAMFDLNTNLVQLDHTRGANVASTAIPPAHIDNTAHDRTRRHCVPYNYIRDQLRTICMTASNRGAALQRVQAVANQLNIHVPAGQITNRQQYDSALDYLFAAIGNWGGNIFTCDGSTGDGGGANRDTPPAHFAGKASLEYYVSKLQVALDSQMPNYNVQRQHLVAYVNRSGESSTPIVIDM